jgi:hypothetical protein
MWSLSLTEEKKYMKLVNNSYQVINSVIIGTFINYVAILVKLWSISSCIFCDLKWSITPHEIGEINIEFFGGDTEKHLQYHAHLLCSLDIENLT